MEHASARYQISRERRCSSAPVADVNRRLHQPLQDQPGAMGDGMTRPWRSADSETQYHRGSPRGEEEDGGQARHVHRRVHRLLHELLSGKSGTPTSSLMRSPRFSDTRPVTARANIFPSDSHPSLSSPSGFPSPAQTHTFTMADQASQAPTIDHQARVVGRLVRLHSTPTRPL